MMSLCVDVMEVGRFSQPLAIVFFLFEFEGALLSVLATCIGATKNHHIN
jgi:uncharacterized integral membrane protein